MKSKTLKLPENITKVLEENNFWFTDVEFLGKGNYVEFGKNTPLGEDWYVCLWLDDTTNLESDFKASLYAYIDSYDVDEEAEVWVELRGKNGVPNSIRSLIKDSEWKLETLKKLYEELNNEN